MLEITVLDDLIATIVVLVLDTLLRIFFTKLIFKTKGPQKKVGYITTQISLNIIHLLKHFQQKINFNSRKPRSEKFKLITLRFSYLK